MIVYFDTSALIPLLVSEPGSPRAATMWNGADRVASVRLVYPEARAALAQAHRLGRLTAGQLRKAVRGLDGLYSQLDIVETDASIALRAGELAEVHGLRGYDAVHLAAADRLREPDLVVAAGDGALLRAASAEGMSIAVIS